MRFGLDQSGLWGSAAEPGGLRVGRLSGWPIRAGLATGLLVLVVPAAALAVVFTAVLLGAGLAGLVVWSVCHAIQVGWQRLRGQGNGQSSMSTQDDGRVNVRVVER